MKKGKSCSKAGAQGRTTIPISPLSVDYPDTEEVHLEQNYRSTGAILDASLAIVTQGKHSSIGVNKRS